MFFIFYYKRIGKRMNKYKFVLFVFLLNIFFLSDSFAQKSKNIKVMDSIIDEYVATTNSISVKIPNLVRYCVGGYEFLVVTHGTGVSCIQVYDVTGKPKKCNND
jgi:hypothetical protein